MQTIVIGHRNPDMDSICSAIAYAELKRKLGGQNIVAARAGNTNERIDLVLHKFGVPAPEFMSDVAPRVALGQFSAYFAPYQGFQGAEKAGQNVSFRNCGPRH